MKKSWLLIHGGWGGSWQWDPIRERLERLNIRSFAPDLPGMGTKNSSHITLDDFVNHTAEIVVNHDDSINIAAFSFGGMTATALAGKFPDRINKLVYIDAFVPEPGQSFIQIAGERITRQIKAYSEVMGCNQMIPPFFEEDRRYCSHPLNTLFTEVHYSRDDLKDLNTHYIECTDKNPLWSFTPLLKKTADEARRQNWKINTVHSDHMPMYSHSDELLNLLAD